MLRKDSLIFLSITCLGFSTLICQLVVVREFLNLFTGNELVLGLVLANWLFLTGVGSYLGRFASHIRTPMKLLFFLQIAMALLPLALVFVIRILKQHNLPGLMLSLQDVFLVSFLTVAPYCLMAGFLLPFFAILSGKNNDPSQISKIYGLDILGDIIGGLLFSFLLIYFFEPTEILLFLLFINLMAALLVSKIWLSSSYSVITIIICAITLFFFSFYNFEQKTAQFMFPGQNLLHHKVTPYGNIAITESNKQITVFENGIVSGSSQDTIKAEEIIHFGMAQHEAPNNILIISGGLSGSISEVLKYHPESIDYVDLDTSIINLVKATYNKEDINEVRFHNIDGRKFVQKSKKQFDLVIVDLPDPLNVQLNRYYTVNFFQEVKRVLHRDGLICFSLNSSENYNNQESRLLSSSIYQSLTDVFENILVVPGSSNIFLASNRPLTYDIANSLFKRGITTQFINEAYLSARLTKDRISQVKEMISSDAAVNEDFLPFTYYAQTRYWLSHFQESLLFPIAFIIVILLFVTILFVKSKNRLVSAAISSSGFAGMGIEFILLLSFQSLYGYVYQQLSIIITAFLIGTAIGTIWVIKSKFRPFPQLIGLDLTIGIISFSLPYLLTVVQQNMLNLEIVSAWFIFPFLAGATGFVIGAQFQASAKIVFTSIEDTAARLYSMDFLGSALGAFVVAAFAVPLLGIKLTCFAIGAVKVGSAVLLNTSTIFRYKKLDKFAPNTSTKNLTFVFTIFLTLGWLIASDKTGLYIYYISLSTFYHWLILLFLVYLIIYAILRNSNVSLPGYGFFKQRGGISPGRLFSFLLFSIAIFFPIFRCYFKVPYLFCHVCPRLCVFGFIRPYMIPAVLIMNIEKRHWCFNLCPIGTLHDCQAKKAIRHYSLYRYISILPLSALVITAILYFLVRTHAQHPEAYGFDWYNMLYKNIFALDMIVLLVTALLLTMAFFIKRPFCELLCPIGTFSKLILKVEEKIAAKNSLAYECDKKV